jgi:ADP-ribosyl-[dinitrogen reductase] hydrolase
MDIADRYIGCLIGTAMGDSLLLPAEGLSRTTVARRFPGPLRQRLAFGRGMVSDDTEHDFLTTQAMLAAGDDADRFARALARRLRWWLIAVPGGCGKATGKGLLRSWLGFSPSRSGVRSAGNGPAMRSAIIGLRWAHDPERLRSFVTASTVITHRDDRALTAALAVALAAAHTVQQGGLEELWTAWRGLSDDDAWTNIIAMLERRYVLAASVDDVAADLGCPAYVSGYALHSVPLALFAWLRHRDDPTACMQAILRCGGDTDTIGAIAGALLGADGRLGAFPRAWHENIVEWPLSLARLRAAAQALAAGGRPVTWWWPLQPLRNALFFLVILAHGLRRLLP